MDVQTLRVTCESSGVSIVISIILGKTAYKHESLIRNEKVEEQPNLSSTFRCKEQLYDIEPYLLEK
jgi:hypothetical protein